MKRPINKQAALGIAHGVGERNFDEREPTQLNPQALVTKPPVSVRLEKAEEKIQSKYKNYEEAAKKHGFPLPPDDPAGRIAWAEEMKKLAGSIKLKDERSFMLLLLWVREIMKESDKPKVAVEIKKRRTPKP